MKRIDPKEKDASFDELEELARSGGYEVIDRVSQVRTPDKAFNVGKGKVEEIAALVEQAKPDKLIFDDRLSAVQIYNLSKVCRVEVIDRFNLILEIFARRARTREAQLQVELASLIYERPKARIKVTLAKKGEQPGFKGLGRYQADIYESEITGRIAKIEAELAVIRKRQDHTRRLRHERGFDMVALAGYTNAGKSTLMNALTGESIVAKDQLFTTLVPTTRLLKLEGRRLLLTDTVGFIRDLPHFMVEAFRSTLEEIYEADLIILVVDASEPADVVLDKMVTCHEALWQEIGPVPVITALNKCDQAAPEALERVRQAIAHLAPHPVTISAKTGEGLEELKLLMSRYLPKWTPAVVTLPGTEDGNSVLSWLHEMAVVRGADYGTDEGGQACIRVSLDARETVLRQLEQRLSRMLKAPAEADSGQV
ncbi:MAG TPA: GTPase HflX [Methanocella sp.]|nr:GTPase HflX [Methanocella sp.]